MAVANNWIGLIQLCNEINLRDLQGIPINLLCDDDGGNASNSVPASENATTNDDEEVEYCDEENDEGKIISCEKYLITLKFHIVFIQLKKSDQQWKMKWT